MEGQCGASVEGVCQTCALEAPAGGAVLQHRLQAEQPEVTVTVVPSLGLLVGCSLAELAEAVGSLNVPRRRALGLSKRIPHLPDIRVLSSQVSVGKCG